MVTQSLGSYVETKHHLRPGCRRWAAHLLSRLTLHAPVLPAGRGPGTPEASVSLAP